jgi:hypothetical protein
VNESTKSPVPDDGGPGQGSLAQPGAKSTTRDRKSATDPGAPGSRSRAPLDRLTKTAGFVARSAFATRLWRLVSWNSVGLLLLAAVLAFIGLAAELARQQAGLKADGQKDGYSPPLPNVPPLSRAVIRNNIDAALKRPANLDGKAVGYPAEVDHIVREEDGLFLLDLSLDEMSNKLRVARSRIAKRGSPGEIDPDAVLFVVVVGRVTEPSKANARYLRKKEAIERLGMSEGGYDWDTAEVAFTLRALRQPNAEQAEILEAISRSARILPRVPGLKINAVAVQSVAEGGRPEPFGFTGGFLPLEALTVDDAAPPADSPTQP